AAECVLRARAVLNHRDADAVAARGPAVRVRHVEDAALLAAHDRPDSHRRRGVDHLVSRETEDRVYAFAAQHLGDCLATLHASIPSPCRTSGQWSATGRTRPDQVLPRTNFVLIIACSPCIRQTAEQIVRSSGAPNR